MLTLYTAYERGYRAAVAEQPRKVPGCVRKILPSISPDWFRGYDEALRANGAERAQALARFGLEPEPVASQLPAQPA